MADKVKNTIVVLEPSAKSAKELLAALAEKDAATIVTTSSPDEAIQHVVTNLPCMLLASINDNQEVPNRIQLFKRLESAIKHHGLKVYVVTPIKNRQLSDMITQKMGVSDYIVEPVPVRTMQFKANLQLKAVDNFRRQQEMKKLAEEKITFKKTEAKKPGETAAVGTEIKSGHKAPLPFGEDTFLFKNSAVRKAGKKFNFEIEGPDPSTGEWVQHEDKGDAQTAWRWVPNEEKEKQAKGEAPPDGWVHKGDKPQFNETTQKWGMSSETPSLALHQKGQAVAQKVGVDETGEVFVAEDSPAAEENLKKNREKVSLERKKRGLEKRSAKELLDGTEEPGEVPEAAESAADGEETPAGGKAARPKAGPADRKSAALRSLLGEGESEEDGPSAGVLNDKRDPAAKRETTELRDKRGVEDALDSIVPTADKAEAETAGGEAKPAGPLAFLQRKKDAKRAAMSIIEGDEGPQGANDRSDEGDHGPGDHHDFRKNKKKSSAGGNALARLKASLEEGADSELSEALEDVEPGTEAAVDAVADSDGEAGNGNRPSLRPGKDRKAAALAEALREDPAERRAEVHDRQTEGEPKRRKGSLRDARAKTLEDIQSLLSSPLPDDVSEEQEAELREELGLKDRPEITPKDLLRKKRVKDAKKLKDRLLDLENELREEEEETGEVISGGVREEVPGAGTPRRKGDLSREKLKGITGAYDGEEALEEREEEQRKRIRNKVEERKRELAKKSEPLYMPEADLQPLGNAWERAGEYYIYLDAKVRYKGFDKLDELLPLWIFKGDKKPELLDKTKQWRFYVELPVQAKKLTEVPAEVRDYLVGLRDAIRRGEAPEPDAPETVADAAEETGTGEEKPAAAAKAKKSRAAAGKVRDLGEDISELLADDEEPEEIADGDEEPEEEPVEASDETAETVDDAGEPEDSGAVDEKTEKRARRNKERIERLDAEARALIDEAEQEEAEAEDEGDSAAPKEGKKEDSLARLRAKLGMDEKAEPEAEAKASKADAVAELLEETEEESLDELAASLDDEEDPAAPEWAGEKPKEAAPAPAISALAKSKSEGVQKFLERRKQKLEEAAAAAPAASAAAAAPASEPKREPPPGYLGIYVALSDAYGNVAEPAVALSRVFASMESSFRNCVVYLTSAPDEQGLVSVVRHSGAASAPVEKIALSSGLSEPVQRGHGESGEILGYLFLGATSGRERFEEGEEATFRRLAGKIWPLVQQSAVSTERKAA